MSAQRRFKRVATLAAVVMAGSACATGYTMAPAGPDPVCPASDRHPLVAAQVDRSGRELPWYAPTDPDDRVELDAWCETVGAPVVRLEPVTERAEPPARLTVVIWNVAVGTADVPAFLRSELGHTCDGSAEGPASPDFVLLAQEAWRYSSRIPDLLPQSSIPWQLGPSERPGEILQVTEIADRCGLSLLYVPSSRNGAQTTEGVREDRGNAILSTLPLRDPTAIELPFEGGRKVAVAATVELKGGPVRVVSVHLDVASTLLRTLLTGNGTRVRQAEALADALDQDRPGLPTLVGGDFNTWSETETALQRMAVRFPDSPPRNGFPTRTHFPTDHAFFRVGNGRGVRLAPGSYRRIEELYHSDHNPLMIELQSVASTAGSSLASTGRSPPTLSPSRLGAASKSR